jgi:predicted RND superfamily exporter protein
VGEPYRDRIERSFEAWGRIVSAHPIPIALASLLLAACCIAGLSRIYVDVTFEAFLRPDDRVRISYEAFREQFGRDERIIVSAEPGNAAGRNGVFELAFLERLRALHAAIEERVPYLDDVTSLVNARDTRGEGDTLLVEDFLDPWPENADQLARLADRALANPLFTNNVISADAAVTTVVLDIQLYSSAGSDLDALAGFEDEGSESADAQPLLSGAETSELVEALHAVIADFEGPDFVLHVAGSPVIIQDLAHAMARDMPRFVALAIFSIAVLLFVLFRSLVAVVTPLIVVLLSVASTLGIMGWTGTAIHVPTQILPSFLLAVGVGDAVHLLAIFFERMRHGDDRADALAHALGHSGLALALTSLTTAGGLASFAGAGIAPIAAIGVFAPLGVMIALFLSLTLLPALIALVPLGASRGPTSSTDENRLDRTLRGFARFGTAHPRRIVGVSFALMLLALGAATRLELSHDPIGWLADDAPIVRGTRHIDRVLGGSVSYEVLLETEAGGIRQPDTLARMAKLGRSYEDEPRDGLVAAQTVSLADVVKEINRALHADRADAHVIPDDPRLVSQELLLFENTGTDDLEDMVDPTYRMGRIAVRMPWRDAVSYVDYFTEADADATAALSEVGRPATTGVMALLVKAIHALVTSLARSYVLAFAIITPLMVLLLGNLRTGLLAMIPNAMPIVLTLGLMGAFGFPLDAFSLLIGGIALGLAVDDTIHFMHNYRRYRDQGASLEGAVDRTLQTAGRAMLITTIVLSTGFLGFVLSSMHNLTNLGILVSFAIGTAFFADVLLAPALLALFDAKRDAA